MNTDPRIPSSAPTGWTTDSQSALEILANDLANNYLDTSLSLDDSTKPSLRSRVFTHDLLSGARDYTGRLWQPSRTILVLGSGASAAAFGESYFPLVSRAIEHVQNALATGGVSPEFLERRRSEESERVATFYGFRRAGTDFETQLGILSEIFSPESVADALSDVYSLKYAPHMTFELIAHMLKHRFIDAVINFNFDELLDIAISEEVGDSHLHYVISDGHCRPLSEIMVRDRLKIPLHIKPHGTVSHKSTLRFTKDQYFRLPTAMYAFMRDIVSGHYKEQAHRRDGYRPYRTNIISVGFGMGSLDLLGMLRQAVAEDRSGRSDFAIFHFNQGRWGTYEKLAQLREETGVQRQYLVNVEEFGGIEGALRLLWHMVSSRFSDLYRPRGIARHEIVHQIFHKPSGPNKPGYRVPEPSNATYFFARLCTEVVLALAKGNGRLDLRQVVSDRVGTYFDRLSRSKQFSARSMVNVFDALGGDDFLRWTGSAQTILTVRDSHRWPSAGEASHELAESLWKRLSLCLRSLGDLELEARVREIDGGGCDSRHPVECLRRLVDSDAQDIKPRFSHSHFLLFRQPDVDQVLHTNLSVTINFVKMITDAEWDLMLTISENGKVLEKVRKHLKANPTGGGPKFFSVIVAETDHREIAFNRVREFGDQLLGGTPEKPFYSLPSSQHNHHMTLLLKHCPESRERWQPVRAIYYEKIGMGNQVSPVLLDDARGKDLDVLVTTFFAYVNKAERAESGVRPTPDGGGEKIANSERLLKEANRRRVELLTAWSDRLASPGGTQP